jgi:1-phosphofructokinase family hexose kinase
MSIVIMNPNPVFDRTIVIDRLVPGSVMRTQHVEVTAGGKGVNVARVLRSLGVESTLVMPVGKADHGQYSQLLDDEGAHATLFDVGGSVRVASIYREQSGGRVTVVNDAGYPLPAVEWRAFVDFAASQVSEGDTVLIMGSLPADLPVDSAALLIHACRCRGAEVLLDTAPEWLRGAWDSSPEVVSPNIHEAIASLRGTQAAVFDDDAMTDDEHRAVAIDLAREIHQRTSQVACVTAGSAGVAVDDGESTSWIPAPSVAVVSAVGAGDSFVAGLTVRWSEDRRARRSVDWADAARFGVACAAASCEVVRAGGAGPDRIAELEGSISTHLVVGSEPAMHADFARGQR